MRLNLISIDLYVEPTGRYCLHFRGNCAVYTQITKSTTYQATSERHKLRCLF